MGSKESKIEESLSLEELPKFFREFATRMEKAFDNVEKIPEDDLADFSKIRIRVKRNGTRVGVKIRVKWDTTDIKEAADSVSVSIESGKSSYKKLKKRMEKTFKSFSRDFESGMIPAAESLESFQRDAEQMVTYKGKGEPFYEDFTKACSVFLDACWKGDVSIAQAGYEWLKKQKSLCHDRFK
jgi:XXXCH domain-containing protein